MNRRPFLAGLFAYVVLAYVKSSWPSDIRKAQYEMTRERDRR